jgi:two-component system, response regulator
MSTAVEILIVEDNEDELELIMRALRKHNLANDVKHVEDGQDALDYLLGLGHYSARSTADQPKLILLDLNLPKVSGIEVIAALKKDDRTRNVPIVVLTSSKDYPDLAECYKLGVNSYIVKPIEFEKFIKTVSELGLYWLLLNKTPVETD